MLLLRILFSFCLLIHLVQAQDTWGNTPKYVVALSTSMLTVGGIYYYLNQNHSNELISSQQPNRRKQVEADEVGCFTSINLPQETTDKLTQLKKVLLDMQQEKRLDIFMFKPDHISLYFARAKNQKCHQAKEKLEKSASTLDPISFTLDDKSKIAYFPHQQQENGYHLVIPVTLSPHNIGSKIDNIYKDILPSRDFEFKPHITVATIIKNASENIDTITHELNSHIYQEKLFTPPLTHNIDQIHLQLNELGQEYTYDLSPALFTPNRIIHQNTAFG